METPKILIVDDELDVRENIKNYLSRRIECVIQEASDGKQALELIAKDGFDVILLDIKMQGISGMSVLKKTRISHPLADIIMITAYDSEQVCREALKEGAVDFIVKPSTLEVICSKVTQILMKRNQYTTKPSEGKIRTSLEVSWILHNDAVSFPGGVIFKVMGDVAFKGKAVSFA